MRFGGLDAPDNCVQAAVMKYEAVPRRGKVVKMNLGNQVLKKIPYMTLSSMSVFIIVWLEIVTIVISENRLANAAKILTLEEEKRMP